MRTSRSIIVALLLAAAPAHAHLAGEPGYSGKTGPICTACHSGGAKPSVALTGPATLAPGETGTYTLTITATTKLTGMTAAASDGVALKVGTSTNTKLKLGEIVHKLAQSALSGSASYVFGATAPAAGTSFTLFAAGLAADGNGGTTGDNAAGTMITVAVATAALPDAGAPADAALAPPADQGPPPAMDLSMSGPPTPDDPMPATGCAVGAGGAPSMAAVLALALLALALRRRIT